MLEAEVTHYGALDMQVCVPIVWTDEQVLVFANREKPSGTNGWFIRREGDKALAGDLERQPCDDKPDRVHIMLDA